MTTTKTDSYREQANKFLEETGTKFEAKFDHWGFHFDDDKEKRDIYAVKLERKGHVYSFKFGQSLNDSAGAFGIKYNCPRGCIYKDNISGCYKHRVRRTAPKAYDVLACLTKSDPEDFETFCANYGYETDSRKAEKIYFSVQKEWCEVRRLFGDVMEKLEEIQ